MSVREYSLNFDSLGRYAPSIVATMRDRIHRFIAGLAQELTEAYSTAALHDSMDISQIQAFAQNIERGRRQKQGTERTEQGQRKRMTFFRSKDQSQGRDSESSAGRCRGRSRGSSSGGNQNRIYALAGRQDQEFSQTLCQERKMITKGCIYHIVRVRDADAEIPTLQSIPVVREYADVFPDELPGISLEREIDFSIDLLPGTQRISITP
ncbi:uncharacterized protein [Nicotiana tomentosiformis]|uniref:uncharacterized protein n=1 Tax=Nicotiana tomentosiformis TaxID=4098 RepID=UPI00388C818D